MRSLGISIAVVSCIACGDDSPANPDVEMPDLVADSAVLTGCLPGPTDASESRAKIVECQEEVPVGLLAGGRVGDIVLSNSQVQIVVRGPGAGFLLPDTRGGEVVDAARFGRDDLLNGFFPTVDFNTALYDEIVITEAGDDGPATVIIRGRAAALPILEKLLSAPTVPAIVEQRYILRPGASALEVQTYLYAVEAMESQPAVEVRDILMCGGGFAPWFVGVGDAGGLGASTFLASGGPQTSYGITYAEDQGSRIQLLSVDGINSVAGPLRQIGASEAVVRTLAIGDGSVSSITDQAFAITESEPLGTLTGTSAPQVTIAVMDAEGLPVTTATTDSEGDFRLALPPAEYTIRAESPGRVDGPDVQTTIASDAEQSEIVVAGATGTLSVAVADTEATPLPARVVVRGDNTETRILATGSAGTLQEALPPGDYVVEISRGVEYSAHTNLAIQIVDGEVTEESAVLEHAIDTDGWISMDSHLHSEMSADSEFRLLERLLSVAAEGVEVAIATDHDFATDYGPAMNRLDLDDWLTFAGGVETSSNIYGHFNNWPIVQDYSLAAGGVPSWYEKSPDEVFADIRSTAPERVIQVNHPRDDSFDFFRAIDFNRETGLAEADAAELGYPGADLNDFNFDAIEVANADSKEIFEDVFSDWLGLVASGRPKTPMGSSDSHEARQYAGRSRSFIYVGPGNDDPATIDLADVDAAIKAGLVVVSQGAFVTASIVDPATGQPVSPGTLVSLSGETEVTLQIKVQAAPWMPVSELLVYSGRDVARTIALDNLETGPIRFEDTVTLPAASIDSFVVVRVNSEDRGDPVIESPGSSFTSPHYYDKDGDAIWNPNP